MSSILMVIIPATWMETQSKAIAHQSRNKEPRAWFDHASTASRANPMADMSDYHHKMTSYAHILSGPAEVFTARNFTARFPRTGGRGR